MRNFTLAVLILPLLALACTFEEDRCIEVQEAVAFTEASSWGTTPADAYAHVDGPRAGVMTWNGGGDLGEMSPSTGVSDITISTTLHTDSAVAIERTHVGDGRLACSNTIELWATVTLVSADGAFDEQFEIALSATDATAGDAVGGRVDLSDHEWVGSFDWIPDSTTGQLYMTVSWTNDALQSVRGSLSWTSVKPEDGDENAVTNTGSGRTLAEFVATE
jgi:hypothetical protein